MRISDWISDVCSSDLRIGIPAQAGTQSPRRCAGLPGLLLAQEHIPRITDDRLHSHDRCGRSRAFRGARGRLVEPERRVGDAPSAQPGAAWLYRSEEHTSELQSLMRISYAVFCLKKKRTK